MDTSTTPSNDLISHFLREVRPARPALCREVLSVSLDAHDRYAQSPQWLSFAVQEVYLHVDAIGSGTGHTLQLLQRFFRWLAERGELDPVETACLLADCELTRRCYGFPARVVRFPAVGGHTSRELAAAAAAYHLNDAVEAFTTDEDERLALRTFISWQVENDGAPLRWSHLDIDALTVSLLEQAETGKIPRESARRLHRFLLGTAARFLAALQEPDDIVRRILRRALII
ncbi:MAG: hypothetical protein AAGE52_37180 [Myxococcota bacterium]